MKETRVKSWGFIVVLLVILACEKQTMIGSPEAESLLLERLYHEIDSIAGSVRCENPKEWRFTAVGEKACGGPAAYVAYSTQMDTTGFLNKVALYTEMQHVYNEKWDVVSDCLFLTPPARVICEDGKAKLVWDDQSALK